MGVCKFSCGTPCRKRDPKEPMEPPCRIESGSSNCGRRPRRHVSKNISLRICFTCWCDKQGMRNGKTPVAYVLIWCPLRESSSEHQSLNFRAPNESNQRGVCRNLSRNGGFFLVTKGCPQQDFPFWFLLDISIAPRISRLYSLWNGQFLKIVKSPHTVDGRNPASL